MRSRCRAPVSFPGRARSDQRTVGRQSLAEGTGRGRAGADGSCRQFTIPQPRLLWHTSARYRNEPCILQPYELFIGLRYTRAKRRNHFISFISLISMLGIGLGVMALFVVLSVMNE